LLFLFLPRKIGKFNSGPIIYFFLMLAVASLLGGAGGGFVNSLFLHRFGGGLLKRLLSVILSGLIGLGLFYFVCSLLGMKEVKEYLKRFSKR
jgi:pilus assembly protein TadC